MNSKTNVYEIGMAQYVRTKQKQRVCKEQSLQNCEILVVDDDLIILAILENALKDFKVVAMSSPIAAFEFVQNLERPPYLIILDVMMPEMDGFELCTKIREIVKEDASEIIFHTASSELEERLHGFEVGANDFIVKPIVTAELQNKAKSIVLRGKNRKKLEGLEGKSKEVEQDNAHVIKSVLTEMGEQANLIQFLRASAKCQTQESLNRLIIKSASDFGLNSSVRSSFVLNDIEYSSVDTNGDSVSPLEQELLTRLKHSDRIVTRGQRLLLNYPYFTQIIKNMPDDEGFAGRIRDYTAIILEAAVLQLQTIAQVEEVNLMIRELEVVQGRVEQSNLQSMKNVLDTLSNLTTTVESKVFEYGLSEQQEIELLHLFRTSTDDAFKALDESKSSDELPLMMSRLNSLKEMSQIPKELSGDSNDVELF